MITITHETQLYGSFSESPGNNGANFFNSAFQRKGMNAIYLPIKCFNTLDAVETMRVMNFRGAAFSKPHKIDIISLLDSVDYSAKEIGAVNTVVVEDEKLVGYNTDWFGVFKLLETLTVPYLHIYGKGGFSRAVQFTCNVLAIEFSLLGRNDVIPNNAVVFNATPIEIVNDQSTIIDGRPFTETGKQIFLEQAKLQYKLYTGTEYD